MTAKLISGNEIAQQIREELKQEVAQIKAKSKVVPGLVTLLGERLEVPVQVVNPLSKVNVGHGVDRAALERDAAALAIAVGLGVRRPGDK